MRVHETDLLESRGLRARVADRVQALDRVKALVLLPDGTHVTTRMVADYFEVEVNAIRALIHDHREEVEANGYRVLTGTELSYFKQLTCIQSSTASLALFSRRTVLNVATLLRESNVARQVRTYLLDAEEEGHRPTAAAPVDNFIHSLAEWIGRQVAEEVERATRGVDARVVETVHSTVREVIGKTVTPLLNISIQASGELLRRVNALERQA
ncbi:restriction endonuclease [Streptomyces hoynatensis]|uniref:Restriction endonuclease n=1 Tax=Streptomyces hoynatensis TaxID=1141874 RepID=A0A3A9Z424_9ACTN|nr:restriction endonuclease [Streptomyces hoynatensis]RKN43192.1 restriction endonuclease [Streptomyces hoynatensis]